MQQAQEIFDVLDQRHQLYIEKADVMAAYGEGAENILAALVPRVNRRAWRGFLEHIASSEGRRTLEELLDRLYSAIHDPTVPCLSGEHLAQVKALFQGLDVDRSGEIEQDEIVAAYNGPVEEVEQLLEIMDGDDNGGIDLTEFMLFWARVEQMDASQVPVLLAKFEHQHGDTVPLEDTTPRSVRSVASTGSRKPRSRASSRGSSRASGKGAKRGAELVLLSDEELERIKHQLLASAYTRDGPNVRKLFAKMDRDHSGALDLPEFEHGIRVRAKVALSKQQIKGLFTAIDKDKSGTVEVEELVAFVEVQKFSRKPDSSVRTTPRSSATTPRAGSGKSTPRDDHKAASSRSRSGSMTGKQAKAAGSVRAESRPKDVPVEDEAEEEEAYHTGDEGKAPSAAGSLDSLDALMADGGEEGGDAEDSDAGNEAASAAGSVDSLDALLNDDNEESADGEHGAADEAEDEAEDGDVASAAGSLDSLDALMQEGEAEGAPQADEADDAEEKASVDSLDELLGDAEVTQANELPADVKAKAEEIFLALDQDASGELDKGELALDTLAGGDRLYAGMDQDGSGQVEMAEWLQWLADIEAEKGDAMLTALFAHFEGIIEARKASKGPKRRTAFPKSEDPGTKVSLKMVGPDGSITPFRIKRSMVMRKVAKQYCSRSGHDAADLVFRVDGYDIEMEVDCDDLALVDGDEIKAHIKGASGKTLAEEAAEKQREMVEQQKARMKHEEEEEARKKVERNEKLAEAAKKTKAKQDAKKQEAAAALKKEAVDKEAAKEALRAKEVQERKAALAAKAAKEKEAKLARKEKLVDSAMKKVRKVVASGNRKVFGKSVSSCADLFAAADKDKSGTLDRAELAAVLKRIDAGFAPGEIDELVEVMDLDGDGSIDYHEFVGHLDSSVSAGKAEQDSSEQVAKEREAKLARKEELMSIAMKKVRKVVAEGNRFVFGKSVSSCADLFAAADKDKSGTLDRAELAAVLKRIDAGFAPGEIDELVEVMDLDGDGSIDYHEFVGHLDSSVSAGKAEQDSSDQAPPLTPKEEKKRKLAELRKRTLESKRAEAAGPSKVGTESPRLASTPSVSQSKKEEVGAKPIMRSVEVVFEKGGPLGLAMSMADSGTGTKLEAVSGTAASLGLLKGDVIVAVGTQETRKADANEIKTYIVANGRPLSLTVGREVAPGEFTAVSFDTASSLGMVLIDTEAPRGHCFVKDVHAGSQAETKGVTKECYLTALNGADTLGWGVPRIQQEVVAVKKSGVPQMELTLYKGPSTPPISADGKGYATEKAGGAPTRQRSDSLDDLLDATPKGGDATRGRSGTVDSLDELLNSGDEAQPDFTASGPVYGLSLEEAARRSDPNGLVPSVVRQCVVWLDDHGMTTQRLWDKSAVGGARALTPFKTAFDEALGAELPGNLDPHVVANLVKKFLSEVPEGLLSAAQIGELNEAGADSDAIKAVVQGLGDPQKETLRVLVEHLHMVTEEAENKMDAKALAGALCNPLKGKQGASEGVSIASMRQLKVPVQCMIEHYADVFVGGGGGDDTSDESL